MLINNEYLMKIWKKNETELLERKEQFVEFLMFLEKADKIQYATAQLYIQNLDEKHLMLFQFWLVQFPGIFSDKELLLGEWIRKIGIYIMSTIKPRTKVHDFFSYLFLLRVT